jgi:hypothetical protein
MVADPAKANEQAAPSAPNVASANTVFRIESLRCLRRGDDSRVAARQKEADRLPHAETKGLWPVGFATSRLGIDAPSL